MVSDKQELETLGIRAARSYREYHRDRWGAKNVPKAFGETWVWFEGNDPPADTDQGQEKWLGLWHRMVVKLSEIEPQSIQLRAKYPLATSDVYQAKKQEAETCEFLARGALAESEKIERQIIRGGLRDQVFSKPAARVAQRKLLAEFEENASGTRDLHRNLTNIAAACRALAELREDTTAEFEREYSGEKAAGQERHREAHTKLRLRKEPKAPARMIGEACKEGTRTQEELAGWLIDKGKWGKEWTGKKVSKYKRRWDKWLEYVKELKARGITLPEEPSPEPEREMITYDEQELFDNAVYHERLNDEQNDEQNHD